MIILVTNTPYNEIDKDINTEEVVDKNLSPAHRSMDLFVSGRHSIRTLKLFVYYEDNDMK